MIPNNKDVIISISGYCMDIFSLQNLHLPRSISHDNTGILSYAAIWLLHFGQWERVSKVSLCGTLYATAFAKEPKSNPYMENNIIKIIGVFLSCHIDDIELNSENIGRYNAINMPPIIIPKNTISIGSIAVERFSDISLTSSS